MIDDSDDVGDCFGHIVTWQPWKKKFALFPKKIPSGKVWLTSYYERTGRNLWATYVQRGTLFDVIRETE